MEHWAKMGEEKCVSTWSNSLFMETVSLAYSIKTEDLYIVIDRSIRVDSILAHTLLKGVIIIQKYKVKDKTD